MKTCIGEDEDSEGESRAEDDEGTHRTLMVPFSTWMVPVLWEISAEAGALDVTSISTFATAVFAPPPTLLYIFTSNQEEIKDG